MTGATQCAVDAVTATVANAKNIPPLLETETKQLLVKARPMIVLPLEANMHQLRPS